MPKAKPRATGTIALTTPAPITKDTPLDWAWHIEGLSGREYAMVIVTVRTPEGAIVYRRPERPDVRPFVISAGSCPWTDPTNPAYGHDGIGTVALWVYVPWHQQDADNVYEVTTTPDFPVAWT